MSKILKKYNYIYYLKKENQVTKIINLNEYNVKLKNSIHLKNIICPKKYDNIKNFIHLLIDYEIKQKNEKFVSIIEKVKNDNYNIPIAIEKNYLDMYYVSEKKKLNLNFIKKFFILPKHIRIIIFDYIVKDINNKCMHINKFINRKEIFFDYIMYLKRNIENENLFVTPKLMNLNNLKLYFKDKFVYFLSVRFKF